jgi:hypothetical protein
MDVVTSQGTIMHFTTCSYHMLPYIIGGFVGLQDIQRQVELISDLGTKHPRL